MNAQHATKISRRPSVYSKAKGLKYDSPGQRPGSGNTTELLALKGRDNWLAKRLCRPFRALDLSHIPTQGVALG